MKSTTNQPARRTAFSPVPKTGGRPTKFTRPVIKRLFRCLGRGMPLSLSCQAAGISTQTVFNYRKSDERFARAMERAVARGVDRRLKKIEAASEAGDWRAAAWFLEHCLPEHFSRNRLEVTGADGAPLSAGVQLYLPQKQAPAVDVGAAEAPAALLERNDDNGN